MSNPLFLLGCGRSGTTLLANLLGLHRDVANWSEANEVWDPQWYPWRPTNSRLAPMEFDPSAFTERWWNHARSRQQEIRATFGAYQWLRRKRLFLNKSPFNTFRIPYILDFFPEARFIHLVRDGRATAYSYAIKLKHGNKLQEWPEPEKSRFAESFDELLVWLSAFWLRNLDEVERQDEELGLTDTGRMFSISYEALCMDPVTTLAEACDYAGLGREGFTKAGRRAIERVESRNNKWRESLTPVVVARMTDAMEPRLVELGYV